MFEHTIFDRYGLADVPCDRDLYLMDEKYLKEYEASILRPHAKEADEFASVRYVSYAAARKADEYGIDLSWYPNIYDRFHEVRVRLPRSQFIACVDCPQYSGKPHIFVKGEWLDALYKRPFSTFVFVDAIGFKDALDQERFDQRALVKLRTRIDDVASRYPSVAFITFADSLILKGNWTIGAYDDDVSYTYQPEMVLRVIPEIKEAFKAVLGLNIFAIATQGANEFCDEVPMHISNEGNHVCMNSMGISFAQLFAIETAARDAQKKGIHTPFDLYLDAHLLKSLRFKSEFKKADYTKYEYSHPMSAVTSFYYPINLKAILKNVIPRDV